MKTSQGDGLSMKEETVLVVVIDDDPAVLKLLSTTLQMSGIEVLVAQSAADAVADLATVDRVPDVIIADYRLDKSELGIDAFGVIRKAVGVHVPGILITGDTSPLIIQDAQASGIRILHKPVRPETIRKVITSVLESGI